MRELSRRIKLLEGRAGKHLQEVYFIEALNLTEKEIEAEIERIQQYNPKAIFFIDDIPLDDN